MVSLRCKMVVKEELKNLGLHYVNVSLGEAEIMENITQQQHDQLKTALLRSGLELMDDKKSVLIEKIRNVIVELVHYKNNELKTNLSEFLSTQLLQDYNTLSNLFSEVEHTTIEQYFIAQKIEKVKELLMYNELSLSEIAFQLNYSSVAYLSNQFKKVTGFTPTYFKQLKDKKRKQIEAL